MANCLASTRRLASLADAAEYAGVSPRTIRRRIADGTVRGYRLGTRVLRVDLNELEEALKPVPAGGPNAA